VAAPLSSSDTHGTSPPTTMSDTKRNDLDVSSIPREEESHSYEMRPVEAQISHSVIPELEPEPGEGLASALQTKGTCDDVGGGAPHGHNLANAAVVAPRDPEVGSEGREDFAVASAPITRQGLPSFAQSEFYTVFFFFFHCGCCF
jgi:hypothetical protein